MKKSELMKTAAVLITEMKAKIASQEATIASQDVEINKLKKQKANSESDAKKKNLAMKIVDILASKKDMSEKEKNQKEEDLISFKSESDLQNYLQALNESSVYSEKLAFFQADNDKTLDPWDEVLLG